MPAAPSPGRAWGELLLDAVLHSYSAVLFARSRRIGLLLLAATLVVPEVGLVGLLGVGLAVGASLALQLDRAALREGLLGYNALLVFLGAGALLERSPSFVLLALAAALLSVLVHVGLSGALRYHLRLPALSLPFVLVSWVLLAAVPHLRGLALRPHPPAVLLPALPGPAVLDGFLRSLGAIFFQPHWLAGLLVLLALAAWSRIAVLHAVVGFAIAWAADTWLLRFPPAFFHVYAGFNVVLTAVALGGVFFVPGPGSLLLAIAGAWVGALLTVGCLAVLGPVGLPVLALPLNLVVLLTVYALRQRPAGSRPLATADPGLSPEASLTWHRQQLARSVRGGGVLLALPVRGTWEVTQGQDGRHTHQGLWRHGIDLEVRGADGALFTGAGDRLTDHHCYRLPVVAPCAGTVVRVVHDRPDTAPGEVDTDQPWGNLVVLQIAPERFFVVAHLAQGSVQLREGETVRPGQELGRCGASGRAPRPHVHLQLQATPALGTATVDLGFGELVREGPQPELLFGHTPALGEQVRRREPGGAPSPWLRLPTGACLDVHVAVDDGPAQPAVLCVGLDLLGARILELEGQPGRLHLALGEHGLVVLRMEGRSPTLTALSLALLRVPADRALERPGGSLAWRDRAVPRPAAGPVQSMLQDIVESVIPTRFTELHFTGQLGPEGLRVQGRGDGVETEALLGREGLRSVAVRWAGRQVRIRADGGWR